ncbi:tigger transposable element-derived protein 4-like [Amphiura filiformis]|uniref:tigger transposable element-derived protein 4-like n=1 Tax=Amphiura filiformis TaxID=82378 RepID=UPI003B212E71
MEDIIEMIEEGKTEDTPPEVSQKKQAAYSLQNKLAILDAVDKGGKRKLDIAQEFGLASSTLSTIIKQRDKITAASEDMSPNRKRLRMPRYADMDKALSEWCRKVQGEGVKLNGPLVEAKAKELATELNHTKFACSNGWLSRFKHRHGISFNRTIERADLLQHIQKNTQEDLSNGSEEPDLAKILKTYQSCDVYCVHALTLYWGALPSHAFPKLQNVLADKNEEHVTLLMACNMDGSKKLPLRAILKSGQSLMCLMNVKSQCPVQYTYSDSAVLTPEIFIQWIQHVDKLLQVEKRRVCFLVDQSDRYPNVMGLQAIRLLPLPIHGPNPCLQGVTQYLKIAYRLELIQRGTAAMDEHPEGTPFTLTLLDALKVLREIWKSIPAEIIQQAFLIAGFVLQVSLDTFASTVVFSPQPVTGSFDESKLIDKIKKVFAVAPGIERACLNLGMQCLHKVDNDLAKKYEEIKVVSQNKREQYMYDPPTVQQASEALETLKHFFNAHSFSDVSIAAPIQESLEVIENSIKIKKFLPKTDIVIKISK